MYGAGSYGCGGNTYSSQGISQAYFQTSTYQAHSNPSRYEQHRNYFQGSYEAERHSAFIADQFLSANRPWTPMISSMDDVKHIVEETFEILTETKFPHDDIRVIVCSDEKFRSLHNQTGARWEDGIMGFSFNKFGKGASEIFVREDHLDSLLLTIGHEVGHVMSRTLPNAQDEEAKAHAFSMAWMETIRENNIAGLTPNIEPNPARNGLHDVAFDFVLQLKHTGATAFEIFRTLSTGLTSILSGG